MTRMARNSLLLLLLTLGISYLADYGLLHIRLVRNRQPFGTVTVHRYYAVQKKNGKTEFMFNPPADEPCVHSLFPHLGYDPCWRLARHPEQRIDI
jgi:hypothetical protein